MEIRNDRKYTKNHEWAQLEGDVMAVGITEYAAEELGDVVFVELPEIGAKTFAAKGFVNVESVKAVADVYAPANGEVCEVNNALDDAPELLNEAPYDNFIAKIKVEDTDMSSLLTPEQYEEFLESL